MQQILNSPASKDRSRLGIVDVAKGLGILAVVMGHIPEVQLTRLSGILYSFHMPLFFFLSGLLHGRSSSARGRSIGQYLCARLVPYVVFGLFALVLTLLLRYVNRGAIELDVLQEGIVSFLVGKPVRGIELWFYPCLLFVELFGLALVSARTSRVSWILCGILASVGLLVAPSSSLIPGNIDIAFVALPFWLAGVGMSDHASRLEDFGSVTHWFIGVPLAGVTVYVQQFVLSSEVDMRSGTYGNPLVFYATASAGIAVTLLFSSLLRQNWLLTLFGQASFVIYPLHSIIIMLISVAAIYLGLGIQHSKVNFVLLLFVCALAGGSLAYFLARRSEVLLFFFTGKKKSVR